MFQLAQDPHLPHGRDRKSFSVAVFLLDALEGYDLAVFRPGGLVNLVLMLFNNVIMRGSCQLRWVCLPLLLYTI